MDTLERVALMCGVTYEELISSIKLISQIESDKPIGVSYTTESMIKEIENTEINSNIRILRKAIKFAIKLSYLKKK